MVAKGHDNIIAYLDDFLCVSPSYEEAKQTLQVLLQLLRDLGFWINYSKIEGPTQHLTFLGIDLDTNTMTMALPPQKITDLKSCLNKIKSASKVTKRALQSLGFHLRRILDRINTLDKPWHRSRATRSMILDINWWLGLMSQMNGRTYMVDPRPLTPVYLDACLVAA